jgi:preprotein translocase subunit SecA
MLVVVVVVVVCQPRGVKLCRGKEAWFLQIENEVREIRFESRPVQVYFKTLALLEDFYARPGVKAMSPLRLDVRQSPDSRRAAVHRAGQENTVTLATGDFGRGTDFVCSDDNINQKGGVHVIQTFVSDEISEEKQIQGACAIMRLSSESWPVPLAWSLSPPLPHGLC